MTQVININQPYVALKRPLPAPTVTEPQGPRIQSLMVFDVINVAGLFLLPYHQPQERFSDCHQLTRLKSSGSGNLKIGYSNVEIYMINKWIGGYSISKHTHFTSQVRLPA